MLKHKSKAVKRNFLKPPPNLLRRLSCRGWSQSTRSIDSLGAGGGSGKNKSKVAGYRNGEKGGREKGVCVKSSSFSGNGVAGKSNGNKVHFLEVVPGGDDANNIEKEEKKMKEMKNKFR